MLCAANGLTYCTVTQRVRRARVLPWTVQAVIHSLTAETSGLERLTEDLQLVQRLSATSAFPTIRHRECRRPERSSQRCGCLPEGAIVRLDSQNGMASRPISKDRPARAKTAMADKLIERNSSILCGTPVFLGTRVPVRILMEHLEAGDRLDDFLDDYPTVSREQAIGLLDRVKTILVSDVDKSAA